MKPINRNAVPTDAAAKKIVAGQSALNSPVDENSGGLSWLARNYRWQICGLLFFASTINYIDRQVIGLLKPTLQTEFGWSESDYGWIVFAFQTAYAIGMISMGRIIDAVGTRLGFALAVAFWSVAGMAHALASSLAGFIAARFALGLGEAGNFPAAIKTTAEWFPKRERALATGIFNSGTNIGALLTPIAVPFLALNYGWQSAFVVTGALGFIWVAAWWFLYRRPEEHQSLSKAELALIQSDPPDAQTTQIPFARLVPYRQTWAFAIGKFLTDPIWWLYLFWLPDFFNKKFTLDLKTVGLPLVVIYLSTSIGSIGGGFLSSYFIGRGWTINAARKTAMLVCALCVVPVAFAPQVENLWTAVAILSLAAAAHQGWSANLFTLASDMFPRCAVGSVVGIGGMMGAIGGMLIALLVGAILQATGSYILIFLIASSAYLIALAIIHLLAPRLAEADVDGTATAI